MKRVTQHLSASLDNLSARPDHANNGAREHVGHELGEERLGLEIAIVLFEERTGRVHHLQSEELVTATLKARDDFANETALDAVSCGE